MNTRTKKPIIKIDKSNKINYNTHSFQKGMKEVDKQIWLTNQFKKINYDNNTYFGPIESTYNNDEYSKTGFRESMKYFFEKVKNYFK